MSLIHCVDCGHAHSREALCCPNCGKPRPAPPVKKNSEISAMLFALLVLCVVGGVIYWNVMPTKPQRRPPARATAPWGERAEVALSNLMIDPAFQERVANAIIHHLHSGGTATDLESYRVFTRGNGLELVMECTVNWTEGGHYQSTIRWVTSERGDCKTELVAENTVLGVISMKNLTTWFHDEMWPQVNRDAGGR